MTQVSLRKVRTVTPNSEDSPSSAASEYSEEVLYAQVLDRDNRASSYHQGKKRKRNNYDESHGCQHVALERHDVQTRQAFM
jgi:hypothetical protein